MASIKKGLEAMASEILEDIKNEAERIIRDAEEKGGETLRKAREEAERTSVRLLAEAREKGETKKKRISSLTEMEVRNKFLQAKEELVNTVFDKALARLRQFVEAESYHDYLLESIQEAAEKLESDPLVVYVNIKDKEWLAQGKLDKLSEKLKVKLVLTNQTENCLGGCVVKTPDEKLSYDNTFEKRLQLLKPVLRTKVAKILFEKED